MWQGLQIIRNYKGKTIHVADTNVLLPDNLNTFFACFEDNTVPSFVADVSRTFKRVNPRKAVDPDGILSRVF
jgi:hypothetical protein